jgi:hypothetical protein
LFSSHPENNLNGKEYLFVFFLYFSRIEEKVALCIFASKREKFAFQVFKGFFMHFT